MVHRGALAYRIQDEIVAIERTVTTIQQHWQRVEADVVDSPAFVHSVALNLHNFYTGLERIMELVAIEMDGGIPSGAHEHIELLRQMSAPIPNVRPSLISSESYIQLDEYRKLRHVLLNRHAFELDPQLMTSLVNDLPAVWQQVQDELNTFVEFLEQLET